ncbi:MAG: exosortase/archaeosortase family protein [Phycisphaerae bacterium]
MTGKENSVNLSSSPRAPSLADRIDSSAGPGGAGGGLSPPTMFKIAVLAVLFAAVNYWQAPILYDKWREPNWSHSFLIPIFSLLLLYMRRSELAAASRRTCSWGLAVMIAGTIFQVLSIFPGQNYWLCELNMIVVLLGLVLYLGGPRIFRLTWLPIAYLALAMPMPDSLYGRIALPLQNFAAMCSTGLLKFFGADIQSNASSLTIISQSGQRYGVQVVEACSGVRSLMAYLALCVAWAYLEDRPVWQRIVLAVSAVPISILCNVLRVATTCEMYVIDKPALGEGFLHTFTGLLVMVPALGMLWLVSRLLRIRLYVEEDEEEGPRSPQPARTEEAK